MLDDPETGPEPLEYAPPASGRNWLTWIADRNPFFLISAACMLWGCLSLTNSSSWNSVPLPRLLVLIGTLNVYEGALIAVAMLLIRRGLLRDGKILLAVEVFFLVDVAFLSAEVVTANLRVGMIVNGLLLVLAAVKLLAIRPALNGALTLPRVVFILTQMLALLALPYYFRRVDDGSLSPLLFYGAWWAVGLMPAVGLLIRRLFPVEAPPLRGMAGVWVCLPWVSMIAHLGILHYAYSVQYLPAMASPVLLGLTFALSRLPLAPVSKNVNASSFKWILPLAAVAVSIWRPEELTVHGFGDSSMALNTLVLTLAATYFTVIYCYLWRHAAWLVLGGAMAGAAVAFGPTVDQMEAIGQHGWNRIVAVTNWVMPKTRIQWGMVSVAASFFFLMLGAVISLKRMPAGDK